jgi:hypothetical protein
MNLQQLRKVPFTWAIVKLIPLNYIDKWRK